MLSVNLWAHAYGSPQKFSESKLFCAKGHILQYKDDFKIGKDQISHDIFLLSNDSRLAFS